MDELENQAKTRRDPGGRHVELAADAENDLDPRPRCIFCQEAGTLTLRDEAGVDLDYTLPAGSTLVFRPVRVMAIASGTFYGWT